MAESRRLVLSDLLCFAVNKFSREELKPLKSIINDFYKGGHRPGKRGKLREFKVVWKNLEFFFFSGWKPMWTIVLLQGAPALRQMACINLSILVKRYTCFGVSAMEQAVTESVLIRGRELRGVSYSC